MARPLYLFFVKGAGYFFMHCQSDNSFAGKLHKPKQKIHLYVLKIRLNAMQ